jgi:cytochrome c oxidase assembly factor CtaG
MFDGLNLTWHWSPITLISLVIFCGIYVFGIRRARRKNPGETPLLKRHVFAFALAILLMALMLLTPIDTIARTQLFVAHMSQIVILTTLCSPLILYACPAWLLRPFFESRASRPIARVLTQPVVVSVIFNLNFLFWHMPRFYSLALQYGTLYHVELISIFAASLLNWWPLIGPTRELHTMTYPQQMLYAFLDGQPVDIFAFLLVFSFVVIYPFYHIPPQLGISAFGDQAAGGALLLIPGLVDLVVMSPLFFRWLGMLEARAKIADERRAQEEALWDEEGEEAYHETFEA